MKRFLSLLMAGIMVVSMGTTAISATDELSGTSSLSKQFGFSSGYITDVDLSDTAVTEPDSWGATPNDAQRYYQQQGIAAFCHFGPNTFQGVSWGTSYGDRTPDDLFTLDQDFDADNIVKTMKEAGFSRIVLTCKHHDGMAIWDCSAVYDDFNLTPYTIAQTNYKNGEGDIFEELSDACTKYNMDMGCYLSPWDIHMQNEGIFGCTTKRVKDADGNVVRNDDGTAQTVSVDQNSSGEYLTYQNQYNEFYIAQINHILYAVKTDENGNTLYNEDGTPQYKYGNNNPNRRTDRFVEWWMDGATGTGAAAQYYDWKGILDAIRAVNPDCQVFGTAKAGSDNTDDLIFDSLVNTGGIHWIGNESGYANSTTWSKLDSGSPGYEVTSKYKRETSSIVGLPEGNIWSVPEVDTKMLASEWFWNTNSEKSLHSMQSLADIYFRTVGNGATLLLNMSPNTDGELDTNQYNRFVQFGQAIKDTFTDDFTKSDTATAAATSVYGNDLDYSASNVLDTIPTGQTYDETYWAPSDGQTTGSIEIDLGGTKTFDVVSIEEYIAKGQKISKFTVEYKTARGTWETFGTGTTIGAKKLIRTAPVTGTAIRINITESYDLPMINNVGVYKASEDFELVGVSTADTLGLPADINKYTFISHTDSTTTGSWASSDDTHKWSQQANSTMTYTFTGSQVVVKAIKDPNHGAMTINIDGVDVATVDIYNSTRLTEQLVYASDELTYGEHTVKLTAVNNSSNKSCIDIYGIYVLDNNGVGIVSIDQTEYRTYSTGTQTVKFVRNFGSKGELVVRYTTVTGSAEQNVTFKYVTDVITFADGETEKEVTFQTMYNEERGNDEPLYFTVGLYQEGENAVIFGKNVDTQIYIEPIKLDTTKQDLIDYINSVKAYSQDKYTADSYAVYSQAITNAISIINKADATNIERGAAAKAVELAIYNLDAVKATKAQITPDDCTYISNTSATSTGSWSNNGLGNTWSGQAGSTMTFTFTGTQFLVKANIDPNHGDMVINVDGKDVARVGTYSATRMTEQIVYSSDKLSHGTHTVKLVATNNANSISCIDVWGIYAYNNNNTAGSVSIARDRYVAISGNGATITLVRDGGSSGAINVAYSITNGTTTSANVNATTGTVNFADGETQKSITVDVTNNSEFAKYFVLNLNQTGSTTDAINQDGITSAKVCIEPLDVTATKAQLKDYISTAKVNTKSYYTTESFGDYKAMVKLAKSVIADENATQTQINSAYKSLQVAIRELSSINLPCEVIDNSKISASAKSDKGNSASNVLDGDTSTIWKATLASSDDMFQNTNNSIILTLDSIQPVAQLNYTPRQDTDTSGTITEYEVYVSQKASGESWMLVAEGTWENDKTEKVASFEQVDARRVMLRAKATCGSETSTCISAAEIKLGKALSTAPYMIFGDINDDSNIDGNDVVSIMKYCVSLTGAGVADDVFSDVNFDNIVNIKDATYLQKQIVGII